MAKTWVLTGSLENFRATCEHDFRVIGAKEGRRRMAKQIEPDDRIVFYVTGIEERDFVPAGELAGDLEHMRKWPAEHWQLAFQGQLRTVSDADAVLLERRMGTGAPAMT